MSERNEYQLDIEFNQRLFERVIIDQHYKVKHPDMNDHLILCLLERIVREDWDACKKADTFTYYKVAPVLLDRRAYRLILTTQDNNNFLGVVNAFRTGRE